MSDDLTTLLRHLRGDKEVPLGFALAAYHRLLSEATQRYHEQPNKPPKLWISEPVVYNWSPEKYAARLERVFAENDSLSTAFPWWLVIQILFQLFRLLLKRA